MFEHRFSIQAWERRGKNWTRDGEVAEADTPAAVGVALVTLTEDGEFYVDDTIKQRARKAAVWDRLEGRYVGGPPW